MVALKTAAQLRRDIEDTLSARIPSALSPRGRAELERAPCGVVELDELLHGGLPVGVISELVGAESSGRTTVALSFVAGITRSGRVAAWIDVADTLDPESAAANGVDLDRLLWVRCGGVKDYVAAAPDSPAKGILLPVSDSVQPVPVRGGGSPHPRSEGQGMPQAIQAMLQHGGMYDKQVRREKKMIGTPGMPNRPLAFRSEDREEQVSSDRVPSHRAEQAVRKVEWKLQRQPPANLPSRTLKCSWDALDQALKAADLLMQGGGFSVVVLDLGSVPPERAWRIPLATWFRFRAACERTQTSLLAITQHPCTRSSAELVVRMNASSMEAQSKVMTGIAYCAEIERQRRAGNENVVPIRKQPQPERGACWRGNAAWAAEL